jgi:hypothetical protein
MIKKSPSANGPLTYAGTGEEARPGDDDLDLSMSGGGGPSAPERNHTNCFLDDAGPPLEAQRGEQEEAEIGPTAQGPRAIDDDQRMVQYLCEAALKTSGEPAAHLHVARTEHTRVLGNTIPKELGGTGDIPETQFKLQVSETFLGGMPPEVNLGTTVEEAVAATARVFGKALDELAARVPQQPSPPCGDGEDEEGIAQEPLGGFQGMPFDWGGPKLKYLSDDAYQMLVRFAHENLGPPGSPGDAEKSELRMLLAILHANDHVTDPVPTPPAPPASPPVTIPTVMSPPGTPVSPASAGDYVIPPATPIVPSPSTDGPIIATGT